MNDTYIFLKTYSKYLQLDTEYIQWCSILDAELQCCNQSVNLSYFLKRKNIQNSFVNKKLHETFIKLCIYVYSVLYIFFIKSHKYEQNSN